MYAVFGADGFFGSYIVKYLEENTDDAIVALSRRCTDSSCGRTERMHFDVDCDDDMLRLENRFANEKNVTAIYLISCHAPDIVKADPDKAYETNVINYEKVLQTAQKCGFGRFIYISSDTVYGESTHSEAFGENDETVPVNIYGEHKLLAEKLTKQYGFTVFRMPYMIGKSICGKTHFYDELASKLKASQPIEMFTDYVRSSLSYSTASRLVCSLACVKELPDTVNVCADMPTSKYDIGLAVADMEGADTSLVKPCLKSQLGVFTEHRADEIIMDNSLMKKLLGITYPVKFEF